VRRLQEPKVSKVVTNYFWIFEQTDNLTMKLQPGLELLAATLIRNSAHQLLIPYVEARYGRPIEEVISEFPPSIKNRLKIIDKKQKTRNKVLNYLQPVYDETKNSPLNIMSNMIFNFMYNLTLAVENEAWADIEQLLLLKGMIDILAKEIQNKEAKGRLDQILGLYNIYGNPIGIPVIVLRPQVAIPSIYERINDILDDALILSYSRQRYLLGVPGKIKATLLSLEKRGKDKLISRKYAKILDISREMVKVGSFLTGTPLSLPDISRLFPELVSFKYNPPLVDLDYYRVQICLQIRPGMTPNFIMPDGATRALGPDYFRRLR
jgi:hypothetical protein